MRYLHTMVRVADLDAALHFYSDLLGLKVVSRRELLQAGGPLAPAEPWKSMPNTGQW